MYALPSQNYSTDLPWPDCAGTPLGEWFGNHTLAQGYRPVLTLTIRNDLFYYIDTSVLLENTQD